MTPATGASPRPRQRLETGRDKAAQRRAAAARLHDQLTEQTQALVDSEQWKAFLDFSRSFYTYSARNCLLIMRQRPTATAVAGYRQWQAKGRQVRKGEQAIKIFGHSVKKTTEVDPETGDEVERTQDRFPILSVFALDQTDPIPGTEDHSTVTRRLEGEDPAGIYQRMATHLDSEGWPVLKLPLIEGLNGYTAPEAPRHVMIDEQLSPAGAAKTILHEAAHIELHVPRLSAEEYQEHRGTAEAEAEAVAYVLAGLRGLDTSDYSVGYVATWTDGDIEAIRATAGNVLTAVSQLAPVLEPEESEPAEPSPAAEPASEAVPADSLRDQVDRQTRERPAPLRPGVLQQIRVELTHQSDHQLEGLVDDPETSAEVAAVAGEELGRRHGATDDVRLADPGVPATDPPHIQARKDWAEHQTTAGGTPAPSYGSPAWAALPADDPARWASVVAAAEAWARDRDQLEQRVADELTLQKEADDRAWRQTREDIAADNPTPDLAQDFARPGPSERRASDREAAHPRPGDHLGGPVPWTPAESDPAVDTTDEIDTTAPDDQREPEPARLDDAVTRAQHAVQQRQAAAGQHQARATAQGPTRPSIDQAGPEAGLAW